MTTFDKTQLILSYENHDNPTSLPPQHLLAVAQAYYQISSFKSAAEICSTLSSTYFSDPQFISFYGSSLRLAGDTAASVKIFTEYIENHEPTKEVLNNFSNALVDTGEIKQAISILNKLVLQYPDYNDARINLARFNRSPNDSPEPILSETSNSLTSLPDPLLAAFSTAEISLYKSKIKDSNLSSFSFNSSEMVSPNPNDAINETLQLTRDLAQSKPQIALKYLNEVHSKSEHFQSEHYVIAGTAYIALRLFADAEVSFLTALSNGISNLDIYLNLANLAAMRGDNILSRHWLSVAETNFPDHELVKRVRETLNSNDQSINLDAFQCNLSQATPGNFTS